MEHKIYSEPYFYIDSLYLLEAVINEKSVKNIRDDMVKTYTNSDAEAEIINRLFAETVALEEYVRQNVNFNTAELTFMGRETAEFLYKSRDYTNNPPAAAFFFYDCILPRQANSRLLAVLAFALNDFDFDRLNDNISDLATDAELFHLIEVSSLEASAKYEVLRLYYNFGGYYAYNAQMVENVSGFIKDKLPSFNDKIKRFVSCLSTELDNRGVHFLRETCNLEISEETEYDIHFSVYNLNSLSLYSDRSAKDQIIAGLCLFDLVEIIKNAKPYKDSRLEFIKVLADSTKLSILRILMAEPCYGGQLADKLSLTGATISYHMSALIKLELVFIKKESVKVYYSLNKEKIQQYMDGLQTILLE